MAFPTLQPSARQYDPGNWANRTYNSQSGAEIRLRYGDKRYNAQLQLTYQNITDENANLFLEDYNSNYGTYKKFTLPTQVLAGWSATTYIPDTSAMQFRYSESPKITSVRPGISTVSVTLLGVI